MGQKEAIRAFPVFR